MISVGPVRRKWYAAAPLPEAAAVPSPEMLALTEVIGMATLTSRVEDCSASTFAECARWAQVGSKRGPGTGGVGYQRVQ